MSRVRTTGAFVLYLGISVLVFGRGVLGAPADTVVGDAGSDKTIFMWAFKWFPHAIGAGVDPLYTHAIWAPHGTDLAWVTAVPGAAVLAWPVTAAFGPVVTYNLLILVAPAASAWTAFLLVRWITRSYWASLVAGYLFGFSTFHIVHTISHLHMTLTFLIPVCLLLVLKRFAGELRGARFVLLLAAALVGQFLFSLELFVLVVVVGGMAGVVGWAVLRGDAATRLRETAAGAALALGLALVFVSPYIAHALFVATSAAQPVRSPFMEAADVINFVVPTRRTLLHPPGTKQLTERFTATGAERGAYLGVPLVLIVSLLAWRRTAGRTILLGATALAAAASLGPRIRVAGFETIPGPWTIPAHLPILDGIKPVRLTLFVGLGAAIACGIWLAEQRRVRARWLVSAAVVLALLPNPAHDLWTAKVPRSTFFSTGLWQQYVKRDDIVLTLPLGPAGWSLLWQAENDVAPRLIGGHIGRRTTLHEERWRDVYVALGGYPAPPLPAGRLRNFLEAHEVSAVIVAPGTRFRARRLIETLDLPPVRSGDALVYRIPRPHG